MQNQNNYSKNKEKKDELNNENKTSLPKWILILKKALEEDKNNDSNK